MDAYQPPRPYMRPPSVPPPAADPYHQYYQHTGRPPLPPPPQPGGYSNQFHSPHSPSPPPQHWGPPPAYPPPYPIHSHQQPFNAAANGNSQFAPSPAGPPPRQPYPQEWSQQDHNAQANSNAEDWALKAKEWAEVQRSATNQPSGQVYHQHPDQGYQDVHQQTAPALQLPSYQQFPAPPPERYPNYATAGLSHQENMPVHQQEVPYSYSSVAGREESGNATQHHVQIGVPNGGGPVHAEQQMQYAYGDQTVAPITNLHDQPLQFATRESSDYSSHHNAWLPHASTGVVYPPIPSSVPSMPEHNSSMAMPPVTGHNMPPYGGYTPPNLQPVGPPYAFGTKPPIHSVTAFMDDSYAASSVPSKNVNLPNWLKEELSKIKPSHGKPSSGSFEEREAMDDDILYKPTEKFDQRDNKRFSASKSSDEEEEDEEKDEDEMDAARSTAINSEIKRILTEVLLKVTDELFDEIATKVINEDGAIQKGLFAVILCYSSLLVQHEPKSSSSFLSAADPTHKSSAKVLVSVGGTDKKADVLGLASYASDDDDADTDAASSADVDDGDGVESHGMGSRNDVTQQPSADNPPEPKATVDTRLNPEVVAGDVSHNHNKAGLDQMLGSRRNSFSEGNKTVNVSASSDDASGCRTNDPDRTVSDKEAILEQPHRKNSGLESDCSLRQDSNKSSGKDLSDDLSRDKSRGDEMKSGKEKGDSRNGSKDRVKQKDMKSAEEVKGFESNKKSTDLDVKKDSKDAERHHRTNSKEDRGKKREKEKEERSRHRHSQGSSKDKRRRSPTSNGSSDDSIRKSRSRKRNISPSPVRARRKRSSPSSDESSDDSRRKSSSRRRNRSPSPGRSRKRHITSRSPHSKHSENKHSSYSSHEKSRSKRSRSRSPRRRHRD
ncbi:arginine/serine-rich protein PNISR isoform X2 [Brassica napus]|uniref:arginine/serine-rich protein PNISR isoform X2 n=1 Tax=Brassica napus TaxID=3708 RepID=UPI002078F5F2|nr:arginine/serine-rich protein PNISR isoform X2 [Brassica napus]